MPRIDDPLRRDDVADDAPPAGPAARMLRGGRGWQIGEYVCRAGPRDPSFEETHASYTIAAVVEGTFRYRSDTGSALLYPGALLLGNHGACYACGHDHSRGDRCIGIHLDPEVFEEVAASTGGSSRFRFPTGALPAMPEIAPVLAALLARLHREPPDDARADDPSVFALAERVIGVVSGAPPLAQRVSASDARRMGEVVERLARDPAQAVDLDTLARDACMSKYHFLRVFRRTFGVTPHQFLIEVRIRRAAQRLLETAAPVATIAFDAGFGDLSTFNARFARQFGTSPVRYRERERGRG
jgi:AraC-like DNA-binding protein